MEKKDPQLVLDQMTTYEDLYSRELPALVRSPKCDSAAFKNVRTVYAVGNGDSYFAALAVKYYWLAHVPARYVPVPALEFLHFILPCIRKEDEESVLVIGISASGGSKIVIEIFNRIRQNRPGIRTLAISGKTGADMETAAEYSEPVQLEEKGRSPGIRTYAASLAGLLSVGFSLCASASKPDNREQVARYISEQAGLTAKTIRSVQEQAHTLASILEGDTVTCLGTGPAFATAAFSSAKIIETSGIFAAAQDLEEWNHVESFSYPLNTPLLFFINPGPAYKKALDLSKAAKNIGHKVILIFPIQDTAEYPFADAVIHTHEAFDDLLSPLTAYIPLTVLSYYLAKKMNRSMFLTDMAR